MIKKITYTLCLCLFNFQLQAAEIHGAKFDDKITLEGKELVLNGLGTRLATLFKIKVYVAGLYLEKKMTSLKQIEEDKGLKKIRLHFLMSVDKKKLKKAWSEAYRNNLAKEDYTTIKDAVGQMNRFMKSLKKGQDMEIVVIDSNVSIYLKGAKVTTIKNPSFAKHFMAAFIGPKPPNDELKKGLLGQK